MTTPFEPFYKKISGLKGDIDVLCVGDLLTDYISKEEKPLAETTVFDKFLGGSTANIAFHLKMLGTDSVLITKIGNDEDGKFLLETLQKYNIIDKHIKIGKKNTPKSYVGKLKAKGTESHENIILRGADTELSVDEIDFSLIDNSKIIHTNAFSMSQEPTRSTIIKVLEKAHKQGKLISFDPNFREHTWPNQEEALDVLGKIYPLVDITKPSLDDAAALFGKLEPEEYMRRFHLIGAKIVVLTMGSDGSMISNEKAVIRVQAEQCDAKDATGAGDLYWAVFLKCMLDGKILRECGEVASHAATKAVSTMGAILKPEDYEEILGHLHTLDL